MAAALTDTEERALLWPMRPTLPGYGVVFDTFVRAAEPHQCLVCAGPIERGAWVRARFEVRDAMPDRPGAHRIFYGCGVCCTAMALAADPDDAAGQSAIAARLELGQVQPQAMAAVVASDIQPQDIRS